MKHYEKICPASADIIKSIEAFNKFLFAQISELNNCRQIFTVVRITLY